MKTILEAKNGLSVTIIGGRGTLTILPHFRFGLAPGNIVALAADLAEIMASPQYKLWSQAAKPKVKPAPKARPSPTSSTSSTSPPKAKRIRNRKPRVASTESAVNGAEANAGAQPHSLTMAEQENAVEEAGGSLTETETSGPRPVKTRVRHRKPSKPRPVVVEHPEAVNS